MTCEERVCQRRPALDATKGLALFFRSSMRAAVPRREKAGREGGWGRGAPPLALGRRSRTGAWGSRARRRPAARRKVRRGAVKAAAQLEQLLLSLKDQTATLALLAFNPDLALVAGDGTKVPARKSVLVEKSPHFRRMLEDHDDSRCLRCLR